MTFADIAALTIHDVKNRLAQLAGRAEAAGDRETVRVALEAAGELTRLLAFYRAENGVLAPVVDAHAPADLLADLAAEFAGDGRASLEVDDAAAPALGFYDETLVRMVLADALHNALRHAKSRVVLAVREGEGALEFIVRDDGPGYRGEVLADAGASAPVSREGTGLGLRLAQRVAELHRNGDRCGAIRLANQGGAVFTLTLPN